MNTNNADRLLQQARDTLSMMDGARDSLDARAQQLVQAAGLIIVLVSIFKLPEVLTSSAPWGRLAFAVAYLVFIAMVGLALGVWWPTKYAIPGPGLAEWKEVQSDYLNQSDEENPMKVWADYQGTIDILTDVNQRKARWLKGAMILFLIQIAGLLAVALLA